MQLSEEVKRLLLRLDETPENFTGRILFMSMFNDISCGSKDNEKECLANAKLVSLYARRVGKGQWSFIAENNTSFFSQVFSKGFFFYQCQVNSRLVTILTSQVFFNFYEFG